MPLPRRTYSPRAPTTYRGVTCSMDDDQGVQGEFAGGKSVRQAGEQDALYPPGFFCRPDAEIEYVAYPDGAGHVIIGWRVPIPSDVAGRDADEPCLYDSKGNRVELNGDDGVKVKVASGTMQVKDSGTTKKVCRDGDDCLPNTAFETWIQTLWTALNAYTGTGPISGLPAATWPSSTSIADVTASSTKLEVE